MRELFERLAKGETLAGEDARKVLDSGKAWKTGVALALQCVEQGRLKQAKKVLKELLDEED